MATSPSWTLWKRLPPRYQLSVRTFVEEDELERYSPPSSPKFQRRGSPRHARSEHKSPTRATLRSPNPGKKRSIQNIPDIPSTSVPEERPSSPSGSFFPYRKSGYIDHFKTQQRVNSARTMMMPTDCRSRSPSPNTRINKQISNNESKTNTENTRRMSATTRSTETQQQPGKCEHHKGAQHNEEHIAHAHHSNKIEQRKYLVRETDEGTMYIDRGKVIYFRSYKSSPVSQASYLSRSIDGSYLASIRREYLTQPRLLAMGPEEKTVKNENKVHEERANYNRKAGHILDYYSYPDEDSLTLDDLTKYTSPTKRLNSPRRPLNMSSRNVKRIYFAYPKTEVERRPSPTQDIQNDPYSSYFKVNQQSKLHDRSLYLKTPGNKPLFREADLIDCSCGMCRIEMQLALMAQAEAEKAAKFLHVQTRTDKTMIPSSKKSENVQTRKPISDKELKLDLKSVENDTVDLKDSKDQELHPINPDPMANDKQEQTLTVTIPKMDTNREITDVAKANETVSENSQVSQ